MNKDEMNAFTENVDEIPRVENEFENTVETEDIQFGEGNEGLPDVEIVYEDDECEKEHKNFEEDKTADIQIMLDEVYGENQDEQPENKSVFNKIDKQLLTKILLIAGMVIVLILIVVGITAIKNSNNQPASLFEEDLVPVMAENGKWGYVNKKGEEIIAPQYNNAGDFSSNGLAPVQNKDSYGYINKKGEYKINPKYEAASSFSSNGLAAVCDDGEWGYINKNGEYVINLQFGYAGDFANNGLAMVRIGSDYGYIDENGVYIINPQFDNAQNFASNGLTPVREGDKWGYINEKGRYEINLQYQRAQGFGSNGLAAVQEGDKWGYINNKGKYVIAPKYEDASTFSDNGIAKVVLNKKVGYINKKGEFVIEPQYEWGTDFVNKKAVVKVGKDYFLINKKNKAVEIDDADFIDEMCIFKDGIVFKNDDEYGVLNWKGKLIVDAKYTLLKSSYLKFSNEQ